MIEKMTMTTSEQSEPVTYTFQDDLNIITGKNGAGKTTFLKLMWYIYSGNLKMAANEIKFETVKLETDKYIFKVKNKTDKNKGIIEKKAQRFNQLNSKRIEKDFRFSEKLRNPVAFEVDIYDKVAKKEILEGIKNIDLTELQHLINNLNKDSLFFPTFRRIEGGFSTEDNYREKVYYSRSTLEDSLKNVSDEMSTNNHKFITTISTVDIVDLITKKYADISEDINVNYIEYSKDIENQILSHSADSNLSDQELLHQANRVLQDIEFSIQKATNYRKEKLKPFDVLNQIIGDIFEMKGIEVTENITLGKSKETIISNSLSAGEKQMLSFICYNTFYKNSVIFIDEPEISLHVDWQRILVETLLTQNSGNQFIVATHSPFIYSNYIDKEIVLDEDRGGY